jgi:sodium-independent sulfate anion transporter 11
MGDERPTLKAVILDFSCVHHMDVTGAQALIDMRNQMTRYSAPEIVEWRFSNIQSRWTKRALASAGFGFRSPDAGARGVSSSIFSIADHLGGSSSTTRIEEQSGKAHDIEEGGGEKHDNEIRKTTSNARLLAVHGLNRPFFHFDLQEAVEATIDSVGSREEKE